LLSFFNIHLGDNCRLGCLVRSGDQFFLCCSSSKLAWDLSASNVGADAQVGGVDEGSPWPSSAKVELSISISTPLLNLSGSSGLLSGSLLSAGDIEAPGVLAVRLQDDGSSKAIAEAETIAAIAEGGHTSAVDQASISITLLLASAWDRDVKGVDTWSRLEAQAPGAQSIAVAQPWLSLSLSLTLEETAGNGDVGSVDAGGRLETPAPSSKSIAVAQPWLSLGLALFLACAWDWSAVAVDAWGSDQAISAPSPPGLSRSRGGGSEGSDDSGKGLHFV